MRPRRLQACKAKTHEDRCLTQELFMKRMHVHVSVEDISKAVSFYSAMFSAQPSVIKDDYAKWMLDDPRVNFAISTRGGEPGLDHLGIQGEDQAELQEVYARFHE